MDVYQVSDILACPAGYLTGSPVCPPVQEDNGVGIFSSVHGHDRSCPDLYSFLLVNSATLSNYTAICRDWWTVTAYLYAQRILIDRNNFLVFEDCFVVWLDGPQVHGHQKRGGKYCPHRHLSLALFVRQTKVADD